MSGDAGLGACNGTPMLALIGEEHAGDGVKGQADFSGEPAAELADESATMTEPPTPPSFAWPGRVRGAVDHEA